MIAGELQTRGGAIPRLGLGTWRMGERAADRRREVESLRLGIDLGVGMIDTAEMYAEGGAERVVGEAIRGRRQDVYLVTKVLPGNASRRGTVEAAERSLRRLGVERIDLYLLHWPGPHPLDATLEAFQELRDRGKIGAFGVSNFDDGEMDAAGGLPAGEGIIANQVLYNLRRRGIERTLLPRCRERRIAVMAYSPLDQGGLARRRGLHAVASQHGVSPAQIAIAWTIREPGVVTLPKAAHPRHVRECVAAASLVLSAADRAALDTAFPAPARDVPLETA